MTENQWPQDGSYASPPASEHASGAHSMNAPLGTDTSIPASAPMTPPAPDEQTAEPSTTEKVTEEAGNVAGQAADSATSVVETAKEEAAIVASGVTSNAKDLLVQAKSDLTDQAAMQQQKVADGLRSISEELRSMASASEDSGVATDLVRQAAERSSSVATWLDARGPRLAAG